MSVLKASYEDIQSLLESGFLDLVKDVVDGALGCIVYRDDGDNVSDSAGSVNHFGYGFLFCLVIAIHRDRGDDIGHKFGGVVERRFAYLEYGNKGQQTVVGFVSVENHIYLVVGRFIDDRVGEARQGVVSEGYVPGEKKRPGNFPSLRNRQRPPVFECSLSTIVVLWLWPIDLAQGEA